MTYNISIMQNASSVMELAQGTNQILGGYFFGYFLLLIIWFVTFVALKGKNYFTSACISTACWLTMLVAIFLRPMGLIDNTTLWTVIIITALASLGLFLSGNMD